MSRRDLRRGRLPGSEPDPDVRDEIEDYLARRAEELVRAGLHPEEARKRAVEAFGDVDGILRTCVRIQRRKRRKSRTIRWVGSMAQELRRSWRPLARRPAYSALAILTLALGVGANASIFNVLHEVLLTPLPFPEPDRLVQVWGSVPGNASYSSSPADYLDWREAESFQSMAGYRTLGGNLIGGERPVRLTVANVSGNFFQTLGVGAEVGLPFGPDPEGTGNLQMVLGHRLWAQEFGSDSTIVGRSVRLDDREYEVVGVMPATFGFPEGVDLWARAPFDVPEVRAFPGYLPTARDLWYFRVVGRLAHGRSLATAQAELDRIAHALAEAYPEADGDRGIRLVPLHEQLVGSVRNTLLMLFGAVVVVFLIACVNLANLALVRLLARSDELALRTALGAGRLRIMAVILAENAWIAGLGGGLGIMMAIGGSSLLAHFAAPVLPGGLEGALGGELLLYGVATSVLSLFFFAALPARMAASRAPGPRLGAVRRGGHGPGERRFMDALVVIEVALAVVLVVGAGLMLRSLLALRRVDVGFPVEDFVSAWVSLPGADALPIEEKVEFYRTIREEVGHLPGVQAVAVASTSPLSGGSGAGLRIEGSESDPTDHDGVRWQVVNAGFFETMKLQLLEGRSFTTLDGRRAEPVAVVNQALARRYFPSQDPVGRLINTGLDGSDAEGARVWARVIGVVTNTRNQGPGELSAPVVYRPLGQAPGIFDARSMIVLARTPGAAPGAISALREAIWRVDPSVPVYAEAVGTEMTGRFRTASTFVLALLGCFAALAVVLGSIGIYGVSSYSVGRRRREMGVRIAMGAERAGLVRQEVVRGALPGLLGIGLGVGGSLGGTRLLAGLLYGVQPWDLLTFASVVTGLTGISLLAALVPALRAASVDPTVAMRAE